MPSTLMTTLAGSTRTPWVRTTWPSTSTRPAAISSSQARRLPTPAEASTFWSRTPRSGSFTSPVLVMIRPVSWARWGAGSPSRRVDIVVDYVGVGQVGRQRRQIVQRRHAQPLEEVRGGAIQRRTGLVIDPGFFDQAASGQRTHDAV